MTEHLPSDPVAAACLGRDALEVAAAHQDAEDEPDHGQFYDYGRELVSMLTALNHLTDTLAEQIAGYGTQRLLRDDTGTHPAVRLASAHGHLADLHASLTAAAGHANQFWSTIGHLDIDTEAPEEHPPRRGV